MVQPHPYFGASLVPNARDVRKGIQISHNSDGFRGAEIVKPKPEGIVRIVTLGGSTTYCVSVSDDETWQTSLQQGLGPEFDVINMGSPGGTSLETLIQAALLFSEFEPDIAVFFLGWNDARVQHVQNLRADWADSHGRWVMGFGMNGREMRERTATGHIIKRLLFQRYFPAMDTDKSLRHLEGTEDAFTDKIDQRAMAHFKRNLRNIVAVCRAQGVTPIFVPQIMNYEVLTSDESYGWIPFVRDRDLKTVIPAYNEATESVCEELDVVFAGEVLATEHPQEDFIDQGHFTPSGHRRFAEAMEKVVRRAQD